MKQIPKRTPLRTASSTPTLIATGQTLDRRLQVPVGIKVIQSPDGFEIHEVILGVKKALILENHRPYFQIPTVKQIGLCQLGARRLKAFALHDHDNEVVQDVDIFLENAGGPQVFYQ